MLQRKQSLFLGIIALIHILNCFIPVFYWTTVNGILTMNGLQSWLVASFNGLVFLYSLIVIFQFKNRPRQVKLTYLLIVFLLALIGLYIQSLVYTTMNLEAILHPERSIGIYLELLCPILCLFVIRWIKKDEALVKSIDRIR